MKKVGNILGIIGLFALVIGLFLLLIQPEVTAIPLVIMGIALLLILVYAITNFQDVKSFFTARSTKYGSNMLVLILITLGIIAVINYIAVRHPYKFDLNRDKIYSLSDQTIKVLKGVKSEVKAYAFYPPDAPETERLRDLFENYKYHNSLFTYEFVDPIKNPERVNAFGITSTGPRIVLKSSERESRVKDPTEEGLTNGLIAVVKAEKKKIYFVTGHSEWDIDSKEETGYSLTAEAIRKEGVEVAKINIGTERIPQDASALVIAGPKKLFLPEEVKAIGDYLQEKMGRLIVMLEPEIKTGLEGLLLDYGVNVGNDFIVDPMSRAFGMGASIPLVAQYSDHEITKGFDAASFFPTSRTVSPVQTIPPGTSVKTIASTTPTSWAETDLESVKRGEVSFTEGVDTKGPLSIAVAVSKKHASATENSPDIRIVVFGDSEFANNKFRPYSGNGDLFNNTVNWVTQREDLISIRPKKRASSRIFLTQVEANIVKMTTMIGIPFIFFAGAVALAIIRRKK
ncbi:MAG: GldG family protein [Deltaproteobacteria bacterium]|nr:GldG family protein [Deltaproteobacteria bacterium]